MMGTLCYKITYKITEKIRIKSDPHNHWQEYSAQTLAYGSIAYVAHICVGFWDRGPGQQTRNASTTDIGPRFGNYSNRK